MDRIGDRKIILGLVILQLVICLPFLDSFPIDLDEPFSVYHAQHDLDVFVPELQKGNNSPLHFILLHFWIKLFGISAFAVRSLSVVFSLVSLVFFYKLAKKILNTEIALLASGFFIFSTFMHYHSMEARMYSLQIMLAILAFYELYGLIFEDKKNFWRLAIWNALLFYTHYLSAFVVLGEIMVFLAMFKQLDKKKWIYFVLSGVISLALIVPGLLQLFERAGQVAGGDNWVPLPGATALYGNIIRFFNYTLAFSILSGLIVAFAIYNRKSLKNKLKSEITQRKHWFLILAFFVPYLAMFVISYAITPVFLDRYIMFTSPFLYLMVALFVKIALQDMRQWYFYVLFVIPVIASCYYIPQTNRDADEVAAYVRSNKEEGDVIVICPPFYDLTFMYHYDKETFSGDMYGSMEEDDVDTIYSYADIDTARYHQKLIFVDANSHFLYPGNDITPKLDANHTFLESKAFKGDFAVYIYQL